MNVKELAEKYEDYVIQARRHIHAHPELSWEEHETTTFIEQELRNLGLSPCHLPGCDVGVYAYIKGGKASEGSKTIMLRADIDALPVTEATGVSYASVYPGKMHACGHDNHAAMLLGAAKILVDMQDELEGTVKLFFQPAEETAVGAAESIKRGIMDDVDLCYSCHVSAYTESGKVNIQAGPRLASADIFNIKVKGKAAHASAPHESRDAIAAAANIITNLQYLVSRINDPMEPLVITVGTIHAGTRSNIIAGEAALSGSVRTYSRTLRHSIPVQIESTAKAAASALGCECEVEYTFGTGPVVNDAKLSELGRQAMLRMYGEEHMIESPCFTASDDFAEYMDMVPGLFSFIGIINKDLDCCYNHHNEKFNVDERSLKYGTALYAQVAIDALKERRL